VAQEVPAFLWTEGLNNAADPAQQARNCVLGCLAQMRLEFAEGLLDGVEVGRIGRQIKECRIRRFDRLPDTGDLMHRQIVHDNDVAATERWNKALLHVSEKHRPIHSALKHERCGHPAPAQTSHESDCFPMSVRRVVDQSLAARTAASQPDHRGGGAGLVDKHQSRGIKHALLSHPMSPRAGHLGALLLRRVQSFF